VYPGGMPTRSLLDTRTAAELSADAAHFETWAERVRDNAGLSAAFRRLAHDARVQQERLAAADAGQRSASAPLDQRVLG